MYSRGIVYQNTCRTDLVSTVPTCIPRYLTHVHTCTVYDTGLKIQELAILSCAQGFVFFMQKIHKTGLKIQELAILRAKLDARENRVSVYVYLVSIYRYT